MKRTTRWLNTLLATAVLSASMVAQTTSLARNDAQVQLQVTQQLQGKKQFQDVQSTVEDGIVTLTGSVNLYQDKLDAAKRARKAAHVQGVRNRIEVASSASDRQLDSRLSRKLYYERAGYYDNAFNYFTLEVKDGVVTVGGQTYNVVARNQALAEIARMPGVKDVIDNVKVSRTSIYDDDLRLQAARVLYRDPVLGKYAADPARPIRIIVDGGHIALFGAVNNQMDKNIAGIRVGQVPGAFSVQNNLTVEGAKREL